MTQKPTYEALEKRIKDLEKKSLESHQAEQLLKSERDKLKTLLDGLAGTNIGVGIVNADYEVLQQNQTLIDRFGDIVGKKCYKEYMSLEAACNFCPMVKALENKRLERAELRANDGRNYELLAAPLTNLDGTVDKTIEVIYDITDRKQAEKQLLFKENIITSSSSVIATCDLDGNMTYGNPSFLKAWGFDDAKEFLGRSFREFWVVEDILNEIMQTLRSKGKWFGEIKAKRKDGTLFDVQVSAAMIYDIKGNPVALTSTSTDITERKLAEKAMRESEEHYRTIISEMFNGFALHEIIVDNNDKPYDYRFLEVNSAFEKITGLQGVNIIGKTVLEVLPKIEPYWIETYGEVASTGKSVRFENYSQELDKYFEVLAYSPQKDQFATVFTDITERKQTEEEREKLINELQKALKEINTLRGILPLCSYCKKIRDDKGYWEQVDIYIHKHSPADISHSICPDCAKKYYPDLDMYD